jgi:hypothetical protein
MLFNDYRGRLAPSKWDGLLFQVRGVRVGSFNVRSTAEQRLDLRFEKDGQS